MLRKKYSFVFGWNVLYISIRSIWLIISVHSFISLFCFCLNNMFIGESGKLESSAMNLCSFIVIWALVMLLLTKMVAVIFVSEMLRTEALPWRMFPLRHTKCVFPFLLINFGLEPILLTIMITAPAIFLACFLTPFD